MSTKSLTAHERATLNRLANGQLLARRPLDQIPSVHRSRPPRIGVSPLADEYLATRMERRPSPLATLMLAALALSPR